MDTPATWTDGRRVGRERRHRRAFVRSHHRQAAHRAGSPCERERLVRGLRAHAPDQQRHGRVGRDDVMASERVPRKERAVASADAQWASNGWNCVTSTERSRAVRPRSITVRAGCAATVPSVSRATDRSAVTIARAGACARRGRCSALLLLVALLDVRPRSNYPSAQVFELALAGREARRFAAEMVLRVRDALRAPSLLRPRPPPAAPLSPNDGCSFKQREGSTMANLQELLRQTFEELKDHPSIELMVLSENPPATDALFDTFQSIV